ncbi:hypothetical protein [Rhizobium laguerreae]|uniref:hypothetical protein n=1 Tax=Rhizobium laguerreae TaxID=1076926 RepID=UPI001A8DBBDD|nr:hypothetical protein [Rhizobium laguerreae]MBN9987145.1 hypothetical protein [Rhizobium laguerreae]MBY3537909.1 hypothetical protein [Rhizobium laguerreae]MBY3551454.1 hypothetical protein [Rhizobium laguerreae]
MTMRFRSLRLRAVTADGVYGADVNFGEGLTVLWADNTKGKSTCMQGMLYALGLEKMLSPRREVPLPHAMTSYLNLDDGKRVDVLESRVSLEISNGRGQIITVHRAVKALTDSRLITVDFGPSLTDDSRQFPSQNFFVLDGGAAQREDGFHFFLEQFLGWELPQVRRYDAPETKLYLETVFPLFWVEQKFGWSTIPAAIPTYMRIREVHKRAVEFLLDLDVYKLEMQRERLAEQIAGNAKEWAALHEELSRFVARSGGRVVALAEKPVADRELLNRAFLEMADGLNWTALGTMIARNRGIAAELDAISVPEVSEQATEVSRRLDERLAEVDRLNAERIRVHGIRQLKSADMLSLQRRIDTLADDLAKNLDVQKLQRYSGVSSLLTPDRCPTCEQALIDTLLSQEALSAVMPIADNIEYIRSQKKMFEDILSRESTEDDSRSGQLNAISRELTDLYAQIRSLRAELVAPGSNPSATAIEDRIRAEARVRELEAIQSVFDEAIDRLASIQTTYAGLLIEQASLPKDKLSAEDQLKFVQLTRLLQAQAAEFGFSTFGANELEISSDSYRPEKEGFEIGFETSASDAIRLKWAYQLSLLELASSSDTNHPQILIFDEPRQQSSSKVSFESLLRRASKARERGQQVIFSTSEDLETLQKITASMECTQQIFDGYILQRMN